MNKYLQYMINVGGSIDVDTFCDDWEPIGPHLLNSMVTKGEVTIEEGMVVLKENSDEQIRRTI